MANVFSCSISRPSIYCLCIGSSCLFTSSSKSLMVYLSSFLFRSASLVDSVIAFCAVVVSGISTFSVLSLL